LRSTFRTVAALASLLAVLALSGVAAGATQSVSPEKWISNFCGSVLTWEQAVKSDSAKLQKVVAGLKKSGQVNVPQVKRKLTGFLHQIVAETNKLVGKLKAVGPPSTKDGDKLQAGVVVAFGKVGNAFRFAEKAAKKLPTTSAKAFAKGAVALAEAVRSSVRQLDAAFSVIGKYSTQELVDAGNKDPSCKKL
jgi:hypothetical protein